MSMAYSSLVCPLCGDFSCKQEARFIDHLTDVHGVADPEACYVEHVLNGVMRGTRSSRWALTRA
jgi:hypothetical protein